MSLLALGINHKTAPVALRERVTFSPETLNHAIESLRQQPLVQAGVVLSTCNRTELYLSMEQPEDVPPQICINRSLIGCALTTNFPLTKSIRASIGIKITMP